MHFGSDAGFSEDALVARRNADLSNDLGNLFSRVLSMNARYFQAKVPTPGPLGPEEKRVRDLALQCLRNFQDLFHNFRFSAALEALWELVRALNKYVDQAAPWNLAKLDKREELAAVLYTLLECQRKIALHLLPVMPDAAALMLEQLGQTAACEAGLQAELERFDGLRPGVVLASASNIFPRLDVPKPEARKQTGATRKTEAAPPTKEVETLPPISFDDFRRLDLRVGLINKASRHPDADKLLCLGVDLGEGRERTIVSGLAGRYQPEELAGRRVIVVANLPPRKIRGITSEGMILTAGDDADFTLLSTSEQAAPGSRVS
jgi:methionyl-tRNA synthetase